MTFQLKRGHLRSVAEGRKIFKEAEIDVMTPARFDMLYLIHSRGPAWRRKSGHWMAQCEIRRSLGLSGATVSKMLARLEELGFVVRERGDGSDRRTKLVFLTAEGLQLIRQAIQVVFGGRKLRRSFEAFAARQIPLGPRAGRRWRILEVLQGLIESVQAIARHLNDDSRMVYLLHPMLD